MRKSQFAVFTGYQNSTLAFNTLTREFLRIDIRYEDFQKAIEFNKLPPNVNKTLLSGRFLIEGEHDEYSDFLLDYRQKRYGPQNLVIYLTPTLGCNAGCEYCFQRDIRPNLPAQSGPDIPKLLSFVASKLHDALGLQVSWFGGEPLLKPGYIEKASTQLMRLAALADKPYRASMVTNGLLLTSQNIEVLLKSKIDRLQISLDGTEDVHNAIGRRDGKRGFRDIIDNILKLPESIRVAIRINVSRANINVLPNLLDCLAEAGLTRPNVSLDLPLVYNFSIENENAHYQDSNGYVLPNAEYGALNLRLLAYAKQLGFNIDMEDILIPGSSQCHAIRAKGYSIWPDGSVTRCIHEVSTPEGLSIEDKHLDITHIPSQQKWLTTEVFENGPCRSCYFLPTCGGSCLHGRFLGLEPPASCPPSKLTLQSRMQWYEAEAVGDPCPINTDRERLVQDLSRLADMHREPISLP